MIINQEKAEKIYLESLKKDEINDEKSIIFYSKAILEHRLALLKANFPEKTLHAVAVKTFSHPLVLKHIVKKGFGLEAASFEEVILAKQAGIENHKIVFDSPVKTRKEILYCHENLSGMLLNANSLEELERYPEDFNCLLGLRINPLLQTDAPALLNLSKATSKFGVPYSRQEEIINACLKYSQITALHTHIGSGIKDFSNNIMAVKKIVSLAEEINHLRENKGIESRITTLDIGGGIDFDLENSSFTIDNYVNHLKGIPDFFDKYNVVTEYGKFVHKYTSFVVSEVEYVISGEPETAFLHVGADLFLRKVYSNLPIDYPYSVIGKNNLKDKKTYNVVGPLCFEGDVLFRNIDLPELQEGDKFVIHNIGANTLSMWSSHCSRKKPAFLLV